jgi:hypothetical protein
VNRYEQVERGLRDRRPLMRGFEIVVVARVSIARMFTHDRHRFSFLATAPMCFS